MRCEIIYLKDFFPELGENGANPYVEMYLPYNMTEMHRQDQKRPCLVICPGGGYAMVSQREGEPVALHFLPEGYNVFVLTYSVAPHRFPSQLREVAAVMELIYRNAERWNCDTGRIAIMGFSAGGHLAAHYSTQYDCPEVRALFPDSKSVQASLLCYPVISADPAWSHGGSFQNLLGKKARTPEDIEKFSLDRHVTAATPPAFLWHTAADNCVPVMNSLLYATALAKAGVPFEAHIYPKGDHGLATCDEQTNEKIPFEVRHAQTWLDSARKWLKLMFG